MNSPIDAPPGPGAPARRISQQGLQFSFLFFLAKGLLWLGLAGLALMGVL
ncbi:MAG: hypothetical protein R2909_20230 [Gemmatimonadales bacterium]